MRLCSKTFGHTSYESIGKLDRTAKVGEETE